MQTAEQKSAKAITKAVAHCLLVNRGRMNLTILADGTTTLVRFLFFSQRRCADETMRTRYSMRLDHYVATPMLFLL